jgi:hypothetical protein
MCRFSGANTMSLMSATSADVSWLGLVLGHEERSPKQQTAMEALCEGCRRSQACEYPDAGHFARDSAADTAPSTSMQPYAAQGASIRLCGWGFPMKLLTQKQKHSLDRHGIARS